METALKVRTNSNNARAYGLVPIGGFTFYSPSITGVPALGPDFVQCNGQIITDTQSTLFGQTVPNLNGNGQFLRAGPGGGTTGGSTTSGFTGNFPLSLNGSSIAYASGVSTAQFANTSGSVSLNVTFSILPPYYTGVAAMRIK